MKLDLDWQQAIPLPKTLNDETVPNVLEEIEEGPGIYIFGRVFDGHLHALYIGQAQNLHRRVKQQLNNYGLLQHVKNARSGQRVVVIGILKLHGGANLSTALDRTERGLLRYFVSKGADLYNTNGVKIKVQEIRSTGPRLKAIPKSLLIER